MAGHRINRAEVELRTTDGDLARQLMDRVSRLRAPGIAPALDRVFSELSGPGELHRLDRLELDLGAVSLADFDHDFLGKLETALRAALARALLRLQPVLQHKDAIQILIRALESDDDRVSTTAHRELVRITKQNLPADASAWQAWLDHEEKAATQ